MARGEHGRRWQNTTLRLNFECLGSTLMLPQLSNGDANRIYNERGEFGAKAHITDDVPPGVVWIRDGWAGLNHFTSGDAVLTGDALSLFPWSSS
jgi:hypothetical protein